MCYIKTNVKLTDLLKPSFTKLNLTMINLIEC